LISSFFYLGFWFYFKEIFWVRRGSSTALFQQDRTGKLYSRTNEHHDDDDVDSEIQMFQNALGFLGKARDVMSPRTEIVAIDLFDTIALKNFYWNGLLKIVVYEIHLMRL
jgi:CBS domain containing-hemolysin-like protein